MKPQSPKGAGEQTEKLRQKLACEREGKGGRLRPSVATVCLPPLRPGTRAVVDLGTDRVCVLQTGGRGSERGGTCSEPRSEGVPSSPSPSLGRPRGPCGGAGGPTSSPACGRAHGLLCCTRGRLTLVAHSGGTPLWWHIWWHSVPRATVAFSLFPQIFFWPQGLCTYCSLPRLTSLLSPLTCTHTNVSLLILSLPAHPSDLRANLAFSRKLI